MAEEQVVDTSSEPSPTEPSEAEVKARAVGWVPKDEFRGDEAKWVDADSFLDRVDHVMPILKKNNEVLQQQLSARDQELIKLRQKSEEQDKILKTLQTAQEEASTGRIEARLATVRANLTEAIRGNDAEAIEALQEELIDLKAEQKVKVSKDEAITTDESQVNAGISPENETMFRGWLEANTWYKDVVMAAAANATATQIIQAAISNGETPPKGRILLDEVTRLMDNKFNISRRRSGDRVESARGGAGVVTGSGKRYSELPADARAVCEKQSKQFVGPGKRFENLKAWQTRFTELYFGQER